MKYLLTMLCLLTISGCSPTTQDYAQIRATCAERKGEYFMIMIPTWLGPRLGAGCLEK